MRKQIITGAVLVAITLGIGLMLKGLGAGTQPAIGTALAVDKTEFDFGQIGINNGKVTHEFTLRNNSDQTVNLKNISTSCMCTEATLKLNNQSFGPFGMPGHGITKKINETINQSEEALLAVVFDPAAHGPSGLGPTQRQITVETDQGTTELTIKALVTP